MPCHKCRPMFISFKKRWSLATFRNLRTKYTHQHIELTTLRAKVAGMQDIIDGVINAYPELEDVIYKQLKEVE